MKKIKRVRWDPLIVKLSECNLNKEISQGANSNNKTLKIKEKWVAAVEKRRSKEEFQAYLHELFDNDAPKVKYQNPDAWRVYPLKKKTDDDIKS